MKFLAILAALMPSLSAVAGPVPPRFPVRFLTEDGWTIVGDYHPPRKGQPVAVLIHSYGPTSTRAEWLEFARGLWDLGMGTLAFDVRGFGESTAGPHGFETCRDFREMDWPGTIKDVDAAFAFLAKNGIHEAKIGMAGSVVGANVAAMAAMAHPRAAWLLLLTPTNTYHGLTVGLGGNVRPTLIGASQDDPAALATARSLVKIDLSRAYFTAKTGRGVGMFKDADFRAKVLDWIGRYSRRTN